MNALTSLEEALLNALKIFNDLSDKNLPPIVEQELFLAKRLVEDVQGAVSQCIKMLDKPNKFK